MIKICYTKSEIRNPKSLESGCCHYIRHQLLFADGHDMNAIADFFVTQPFDHSAGDTDSSIQSLAFGGVGHFFDQVIGHEDAGDIFVHVSNLNGVELKDGDSVEYEEAEGRKGMVAVKVSVIYVRL